eukprot:TRINITY_DN75298_c0_g1_i1.p1 TRINITY_DN75298_c0_g1~~TRINITY_DN75298_c0_g1_i1.p1  ORF type:complete len:488 (-),score=79.61 TRINITY_DN75298_c0_g1_i1:38-1384(-)
MFAKVKGSLARRRDKKGEHRLVEAARAGHLEEVRELLALGVDPDAPTQASRPASLLSGNLPGGVDNSNHLECLKLLVAAKANLDVVDYRDTPLMRAISACRLDCVEALIFGNADVNYSPNNAWYGKTALMCACNDAKIDIFTTLIAARADVNLQEMLVDSTGDRHGKSAAMYAASFGSVSCLQALVAARADLNARCGAGIPALIYASQRASYTSGECLKALLAAKVDSNSRSASDQTALMAAAYDGQVDKMETLLAARADVSIRDAAGSTALHYAARSDPHQVGALQMLLKALADANVRDLEGKTALDVAIFSRDTYSQSGVRHGYEKIAGILRKAMEDEAARALAEVQLLTIHATRSEDGASVAVFLTSMAGSEVKHVQASVSTPLRCVLAEIQAELSPRPRRFMLADGRLMQELDQDQALGSVLSEVVATGEPQADQRGTGLELCM